MRPFGPFPANPGIAVALSGGADSLALLVLMQRWAARRDGDVTALIVDHGLRPESADEAAGVARQATQLGAEAAILRWEGEKPGSAIQAGARAARYRLLQQACRARGLIYLALAHHADDQAETFLLRLDAGSSPSGLAGMSGMVALADALVLRPLLGVPKQRLQGVLCARGLGWVEDPSNRDRRYRRTALRRLAPILAADGLDLPALGEATGALGAARRAFEAIQLDWLARHSSWRPAGYAVLERSSLLAVPPLLGRALLGQVLRAVGGRDHVPAQQRSGRLLTHLKREGAAATLGGCRIISSKDRILVVREERGPPSVALRAGKPLLWDGRFRARVGSAAPGDLRLEPLTRQGWQQIHREVVAVDLPGPVLWSLPCVRDAAGLRALPLLDWWRADRERFDLSLDFRPAAVPGGTLFAVA